MGIIAGAIATFVAPVLGSGAISVIVGQVVSQALIGAAIGGLSAAVVGGDIGSGMLYGAIGGAASGALTGFLQIGIAESGADAFSGMTQSYKDSQLPKTETTTVTTKNSDGTTTTKETTAAAESKSLFGMDNSTATVVGHGLSGLATGLLAKDPEEMDYAAQASSQMEVNQQTLDAQAAESALAREASMAELQTQLASQLDLSNADLAEQRRQYDVSSTAAAARQQDAATSRGVLTVGQGTGTTATYDPALNNVLDNELYQNVAGA